MTDPELDDLRLACERFVAGHGPTRVSDMLRLIPPDTEVDRYGAGGVVAELEKEVATLLGKPAAVFVPSGTMAQQAVLRVHADRRGRSVVAFHPTCHLQLHEDQALERVMHLSARTVGDRHRLLTLEDLREVAEPLAALLLELPQREIGGLLPSLDDVRNQAAWARERGAAVHLDGARLWEAAAGYDVSLAEVAEIFDSVYVSFYKGIGALPGCCIAADEDVVAEVREWRHRLGGTLFGLWPNAASALSGLRERLPRMPSYLAHARAVADALRDLDGVAVVPDPPQTSMMHLLLRVDPDRFLDNVKQLARTELIWTWPHGAPTGDPAVQKVELSVGDATCALTPTEIRDAIAALLG